jgi:hypothetical protein
MKEQLKINDTVRIGVFPEKDPDGYARVGGVYKDGRVWLVNANMPFMGSINTILTPVQLKKWKVKKVHLDISILNKIK